MEVSLCVALHLSITLPIRDASDGPVICSGIAPSSYTDIMVHDGASISDRRRRRLDRVPLHCTVRQFRLEWKRRWFRTREWEK